MAEPWGVAFDRCVGDQNPGCRTHSECKAVVGNGTQQGSTCVRCGKGEGVDAAIAEDRGSFGWRSDLGWWTVGCASGSTTPRADLDRAVTMGRKAGAMPTVKEAIV